MKSTSVIGRASIPVVGVGASAGGLAASKKLLSTIPRRCGMAFVIVHHGDPHSKGRLISLLSKACSLCVVAAEDGLRIEADTVYVVHPAKVASVASGLFILEDRGTCRHPIDYFLTALADDIKDSAIGIILSGTGSDGSKGIRAIKSQGGLAMAQAPECAEFDGMPQCAIMTNLLDYVLPTEELIDAIETFVKHSNVAAAKHGPLSPSDDDCLDSILALLQARLGCNFRAYKRPTLLRRIKRRMGLKVKYSFGEYLHYLRTDMDELQALYGDFLIHVTGFFRDPSVWDAIDQQLLDGLIAGSSEERSIRVWVPGCSTGEEAYTIAMLVYERLNRVHLPINLQVFATDIDEKALRFARTGFYPASIENEISSERLHYFFKREGDGYQVASFLRDCMIFSAQNLLADPPFSRMDLISCRNLLIYLEHEMQQKVIRLFHFALCEEGYLVLGNSETVGADRSFKIISKQYRLFQRLAVGATDCVAVSTMSKDLDRTNRLRINSLVSPRRATGLSSVVQREIMRVYAPPSILVNRIYKVLYISGDMSPWLKQPTGVPSSDLFSILVRGFITQLKKAIKLAQESQQLVEVKDARIRRDGVYYPFRLMVSPVKQVVAGEEGLLLISFEQEKKFSAQEDGVIEISPEEQHRTSLLEDELTTAREELQHSIEEIESSNEELMSMNEELQSSNEELESSKEELQSLNEELHTVNRQLQEKVADLELINNDLVNLVSTTEMAILFLDAKRHIRRFTPAICEVLNFIPTDVGRPIDDISLRVDDAYFLKDIDAVIEYGEPISREIRVSSSRWYRRKTLPYRTQNKEFVHEGVVIVFDDISILKQQQMALHESELQKVGILDNLQESVLYLDTDLYVRWVNQHALDALGVSFSKIIDRKCCEVFNGVKNRCGKECLPARAIEMKKPVSGERRVGEKVYAVCAIPLLNEEGHVISIVETSMDITLQKNAQCMLEKQVVARTEELQKAKEILAESEAFLERTGQISKIGGWELSLINSTLRRSKTLMHTIYELSEDDASPVDGAFKFYKPADQIRIKDAIERAKKEGVSYELELEMTTAKGNAKWVKIIGEPVMQAGCCIRLIGTVQDITERKKSELKIESLSQFPMDNPNPMLRFSAEGDILYANPASKPLLESWGVRSSSKVPLKVLKWITRALKLKAPLYEIEVQYENRWAQLVFAPEKKNRYVNVYGLDITLRKKGEDQLAHSEENLRLALDAVSEGIWELLVPLNELRFNVRSLEMFGFDPSQPHPDMTTIFSRIHENDQSSVQNELKLHVGGALAECQKEFRIILPNDRTRWILCRGKVIERDSENHAIRLIGTFSDITAAKSAELEVLRMQNLDSLGTLAGGIAHDFNNVLMGIYGNITLAKLKLDEEDPCYRILQRAEESMPRATKLTGQLLTFAKGGEPITDLVHLKDLMQEVVEFDLMGSNVKPLFDCPSDLWNGKVDRSQMQQVFSNLTINAREAMPEGGLFKVCLKNQMVHPNEIAGLKAGNYIQITMEDEGVGIHKNHLTNIFDPYFTTKQLGHGLGLATAYSVVKRHGGMITVESEENQGTLFTLRLPASAESDSTNSIHSDSVDQALIRQPKRPNDRMLRVLVMDDEYSIRLVVSRMLEMEGFDVITTSNGAETTGAFKAACDQGLPFDLVILDLTIPGESGGLSVLTHLKKVDPGVVAVVASGYASEDVIANCQSYGFKGVVVKPFLRKDLIDVIDHALAGSSS